jgi:hypothetical protein
VVIGSAMATDDIAGVGAAADVTPVCCRNCSCAASLNKKTMSVQLLFGSP